MNKYIILSLCLYCSKINTGFSIALDSLRMENKDGKNFVIHKVEKGQTLYGTLRKYGTSMAEYKLENPNADLDIKIGQIIRIPYFKVLKNKLVTSKPTSSKSLDSLILKMENEQVVGYEKYFSIPPKVHIVESGNTLFKIAKKVGTSVADIRRLNSLETDLIEIGQVLLVSDGKLIKGKSMPKVVFEENIAIENFQNKKEETIIVAKDEPVIVEPVTKVKVVEKPVDIPKVVQPKPSEKVVDEPKKVVPKPVEKVVEAPKPTVKEPVVVKTDPVIVKSEPKIDSTKPVIKDDTERYVKVEEGIAELIEVESKSGKYLALHKTVPLGTLVQVRNETNGATVWVKIIGRLPQVDENQNVIIKLSPKAMDRVSPVDKRFRAKINYSL